MNLGKPTSNILQDEMTHFARIKGRHLYREIGIGIISSLLASGLLFFLSSVGLLFSILSGAIILCSTLAYFIGRNTTQVSAINSGTAGIVKIEIDQSRKVSTEALVPHIEHSFTFWGISAKRTLAIPAFKQWLETLQKSQIKVKFLLLDPESPHLARKAEDEGDNPDAWIREINANISRIGALCYKYPSLMELRVYSEFPIWRVIFIDEKLAIIHYFPSGKQGPESPQFIVKKEDGSLFEPIYKEFIEVWNHRSKRIAP